MDRIPLCAAKRKANHQNQTTNQIRTEPWPAAQVRIDKAWIGSIDISMKKPYPSRVFDMETKELAKHSPSGSQFFIPASNDGQIMVFAGGIPQTHDGPVCVQASVGRAA